MLGRRWLCWIVGTATAGERAAAILRDEIEHGALANIAAASQVWSTHHRDLLTPEATRRLAAEFGGLLDTVLDLLTPPPRSAAAASLPPPAAMPDYAADQGRQTIEPLPVLRARRSVPLGGAAEIHTRLRNDGPTPAEIGFVWSDLVAEPDGRIHAGCLRLLPGRVRVPPGACVDLAIGLRVPDDARPGLYHALLQATERVGLRALLTFPVGLEC
jgi:enamine deaminase RidA (YjgF/YER057c/UK114 family)